MGFCLHKTAQDYKNRHSVRTLLTRSFPTDLRSFI